MAVATVEGFGDSLNDAFSWRRMELQALRSELENLKQSEIDRPFARMILRSGVALIYAHWEGFCKQVLQGYLEYVARRRLKYKELRSELVATAVRPRLEHMAKDDVALKQFVTGVFILADERAVLPKRGVVDTGSNLRYERFISILDALGLDKSDFETREHLIDVRLCDARNDIAHGGSSVPDKTSVLELIVLVLDMMNALKNQLENAVATKAYRAVVA